MKYKSTLLAQASGSVAGATFSRNKGGPYIRARVMPTNRNTDPQSNIKSVMGALANVFSGLTIAERATWESYSAAVNYIDRLGESRKISAINNFIRSNIVRVLYHASNIINRNAPTEGNCGATPVLTDVVAHYKSAGILTISGKVNIVDAPASPDYANLVLFFGSPAMTKMINYYKGPFSYCDQAGVSALASQPQNFSFDVLGAWNSAGGDKAYLRVEVSRADGRLSPSVMYGVVTEAAP
jgi:hypothetical protein